VPTCSEDGYPMVPVGETLAGQMKWGCTNPWHPRNPRSCPNCGHPGPHRSALTGTLGKEARRLGCDHRWTPFNF